MAVMYCDLCGKEAQHLSKCAVCKREMCSEDGMKFHAAYALELYRYDDANRLNIHVCKTCADMKVNLTICQLLDGMMERTSIVMAEQ
ncbi:hypothetical protein HY415_01015 [Candidatus Kaiserbacteria bacterium]|nr:hypothetical protein [Candidatus Kaiserbacteria bacterium]